MKSQISDVIKLLEAISYDKTLEGGASRPWLMMALDAATPKPYVVKIYGFPQQFHYPKLSDIVCSVIAPHFGLHVPEWGLIRIDKEVYKDLPRELKTQLNKNDSRLNFCTLQIEGAYQYASIGGLKPFIKDYSLENIFAFDSLVKNVDRRAEKPNILFKERIAYLIDHERTLYIDPQQSSFDDYRYNSTNHIFYPYLNGLTNPKKSICFDHFITKLKSLNLSELDKIVSIARDKYAIDTEQYETMYYYIESIIENADKFKIKLIQNIS